jgi:ubiquinone/menaquinone biosynthesis C-methylase UbiE
LDVCSGTGALLASVLDLVPGSRGACLDLSPEMLKRACGKGLMSIRADALYIPLINGSVDCVMMRQALQYIEKPQEAIREIYRVLRFGGQVLMGQFVPYDADDARWMDAIHLLRQPHRKHFFSAEAISSLLSAEGMHSLTVVETIVEESLMSWLNRYQVNDEATKQEIWNRFAEAAQNSHTRRRIIVLKSHDIVFTNRFALIRGLK